MPSLPRNRAKKPMKTRLHLSAVACFILFCATSPSVRAQSTSKTESDTVENYLRLQMQKRHIPGMQVAVVQHGKIVLLGAYGKASLQDSIPVTGKTVFPIFSITKAFTGVAAVQLVEAGKLDLAAPVSQYLDGLPQAWRMVTIRQLLTHESGLPNILDNETGGLIAAGEDAAWAKVQAMPMEFAPGEKFSYCQTNYLLIGRIIDKLSGEPFTRFIAEKQLDVVGMPLTRFGDGHVLIPHGIRDYSLARGFSGDEKSLGRYENLFVEFSPSLLTAAGMNSTAEEMARWIIALQQGKLFKEKSSLDLLWTPGKLNDGLPRAFSQFLNGYALGWPVALRSEHRALAPVGGGHAAVFVYPDDDLTVVILTNLKRADPESFIDEVAGYYVPGMKASTGFGLPPSIRALRAELMKRGFENAPQVVSELKKNDARFELTEEDVNAWGYKLVEQKQVAQAIEIFKLNVSLYPQSWNVYDSLAEAYENVGDKSSSVKNYERSLAMNPKNDHAVERLKALAPNGAAVK
jgi:CubicO group peptidase (beta-lactamase class C family)